MRELPGSLLNGIRNGGRGLSLAAIRLGAMGDILRTLPAVRLLRQGLPRASVSFVVDDRWAGLLDHHPDIDTVISLPRRRFEELSRDPLSWGELVGMVLDWSDRVRRTGPALVLDFHGNFRSGMVSALSGGAVRLGYGGCQQKEGNLLFSTHRIDGGNRRTPRMERNLALVRALGLAVEPLPDGGLPEKEEDGRRAERLVRTILGDERPYAVISPGASARQAYKKPPPELLVTAAVSLSRRGVPSMVVYGPGEEQDAARVVDGAGGEAFSAPPTDLPLLAALIRRSTLFISGDTGPLHMACAVGCPVIGIYGPTDPEVNSPWGVPHIRLFPPGRVYTGVKRIDREAGGFEGITADAVEGAVGRLLTGRPGAVTKR